MSIQQLSLPTLITRSVITLHHDAMWLKKEEKELVGYLDDYIDAVARNRRSPISKINLTPAQMQTIQSMKPKMLESPGFDVARNFDFHPSGTIRYRGVPLERIGANEKPKDSR